MQKKRNLFNGLDILLANKTKILIKKILAVFCCIQNGRVLKKQCIVFVIKLLLLIVVVVLNQIKCANRVRQIKLLYSNNVMYISE